MDVDFDSTLGATYIGVTLTTCLYGIATLQVYTYWNRQRQDNVIARISIAVLWLVDTIKMICATHIGFRLLITDYESDPATLFHSFWSINLELLLTTLIIFVSQGFSAYHVWKSAKRINIFWATPRVIHIMGIIVAVFALAQLSFGIAVSSLAWVYWDVREMDKHRWVAVVWMGSATICSAISTYTLLALLASKYERVQNIVDLINEFLRCFIHTGLLTGILTLVNLLAFSYMGQYIRIAVNFPLGTLNLVTLLAVLNSRSGEVLDHEISEEYGRYTTEHNNGFHSDADQTSHKASMQIGKLTFKGPSKLRGRGTSIKVFVRKETHVIGLQSIKANYSNPTMQQNDDPDGTESTRSRADLAKPHASPI